MPYKVFRDGDKFCLHKENPDGSKGDEIGCHATRDAAMAQMRAVYANESKEAELQSIMDAIKEQLASESEDSAESVKQLVDEYMLRKSSKPDEAALTGSEEKEMPKDVGTLNMKVEIEDMPTFIGKLKSIAESISSALGSLFSRNKDTDMMIWKEKDGGYRWIGRYSNNFRDNDNPPEIISAASHRRFVELVDKGLAPLPELWIWHVKSLRIGKADWVAYDDSGFALAGGHSLPGTESVFEKLATIKGITMSHGMPDTTIKRDEIDKSILIEHETREISVLPSWSAANKITGFAVLSKEEVTMIPAEKKVQLAKEWGLSEAQITAIEALNAEDASKAIDAGIEHKEIKEESAAAVVAESVGTAEPAPEKTAAPVETPAEPPAPTIEQVRETLQTVITEALQPYTARLDALEAMVKELKQPVEAQIAKEAVNTPLASIGALVAAAAKSAVGDPSTLVDGRTTLAKSKPAEAEVPENGQTFVPFINKMLAPKQQ